MNDLLSRELKDWTFDELVRYNQANILMAIPVGKFNDAVWQASDLTLRWKAERDKK